MALMRPTAEGSPVLTLSEDLTITSTMLLTSAATMPWDHIATVGVVPIAVQRPAALPWMILVMAATYFLYSILPIPPPFPDTYQPDYRTYLLATSGAVLALIGALAWWPRKRAWRLVIGCSDGSTHHFIAPEKEILEKARRLITKALADRSAAVPCSFDFRTGELEFFKGGEAQAIAAALGETSDAVRRGADGEAKPQPHSQAHPQPHGIRNGQDLHAEAESIDYAQMLPTVGQWGRYFAEQGRSDITNQLTELEELMKSGTPTYLGRKRVVHITRNLVLMLGGGAEIQQFFGSISRLASSEPRASR
jgi:hypothetical protein